MDSPPVDRAVYDDGECTAGGQWGGGSDDWSNSFPSTPVMADRWSVPPPTAQYLNSCVGCGPLSEAIAGGSLGSAYPPPVTARVIAKTLGTEQVDKDTLLLRHPDRPWET
jgi:hypothetical protein